MLDGRDVSFAGPDFFRETGPLATTQGSTAPVSGRNVDQVRGMSEQRLLAVEVRRRALRGSLHGYGRQPQASRLPSV